MRFHPVVKRLAIAPFMSFIIAMHCNWHCASRPAPRQTPSAATSRASSAASLHRRSDVHILAAPALQGDPTDVAVGARRAGAAACTTTWLAMDRGNTSSSAQGGVAKLSPLIPELIRDSHDMRAEPGKGETKNAHPAVVVRCQGRPARVSGNVIGAIVPAGRVSFQLQLNF